MKLSLRSLLLSLLFMLFVNINGFAQRGTCNPSERWCDGKCKEAKLCAGNPPPPGLVVPIDTNISLLLAAGLGLGIFFLISSGKKEKA